MTGPRTLRAGAFVRATVSLLTLTTAVLLAPVGHATPQSDADDAITAAWNAGGGDTGPLGPRDGDVYPVGDGFGQKFAAGTIFYTPATGAHLLQGAILDKYESLGGPADSDLGFPTIDEGAGRAPDSRNNTFSATDKPVIFWTPDAGAHVVRGAINAAWDKLGGSAGSLGVPAEDEVYDGDVVTQKFTGGQLSWNRRTTEFNTVPPELAGQLAGLSVPEDATSAINAARRTAGGPMGPLGAKQGPQYPIGPDGAGQDFAGGKIFYSPATGANVLTGQVLAKYLALGGPPGDLGFPASSEADGGLATPSRFATFTAPDKPVIFWTADYGAVLVRGAMSVAWSKLGGAPGPLGAPVADQDETGNMITQRFSGGDISWNAATNKFTTQPPKFETDLTGLQVPGYQPPPAPKATPASNSNDDNWFAWRWWYLLIIVPALLVVLALTLALVLRPGRAKRRDNRWRRGRRGDPESRAGFVAEDVDGPLADNYVYREGEHFFTPTRPPRDRDATEIMSITTEVGGPHRDELPDADVDGDEEPVVLGYGADAVDTVPTRIPPDAEPTTGRHAAVTAPEPARSRPSIHLPLADSDHPPEGYPIKASISSGRYWLPGSGHYHEAIAEIWFTSEELAQANGFVRAD